MPAPLCTYTAAPDACIMPRPAFAPKGCRACATNHLDAVDNNIEHVKREFLDSSVDLCASRGTSQNMEHTLMTNRNSLGMARSADTIFVEMAYVVYLPTFARVPKTAFLRPLLHAPRNIAPMLRIKKS
eukprot:6187037-Pleurochrysis_carterae.AAC.2